MVLAGERTLGNRTLESRILLQIEFFELCDLTDHQLAELITLTPMTRLALGFDQLFRVSVRISEVYRISRGSVGS